MSKQFTVVFLQEGQSRIHGVYAESPVDATRKVAQELTAECDDPGYEMAWGDDLELVALFLGDREDLAPLVAAYLPKGAAR